MEIALRLLKQSIEQDATIIAIGPFTNLYLLDRKHPGILRQAKLFLMGGYIHPIRPGFPKWRAEWEQWAQMKFPQSGEYSIPGALNPIRMDIEKDEGIYVEPNVWLQHTIV